ncbi:Protein of unknown function [Escherichia coli D6-113.11]|nr:Protein of unknown function [Escherichia coli D6-113.11]CDU34861.1 Protein of unknown function [Escherichia coli D6-113.11]
MVISVSYMVG